MRSPNAVADVWVIAGPPGAGKSTTASELMGILDPVPALLDKDTMFGPITAASLKATGRPLSDREGPWYDQFIKPHEYAGIIATAREIRLHGCPVVISAPFTTSSRDEARWEATCDLLGGGNVRMLWVYSDAETIRKRLFNRSAERDCGKYNSFDEFIERVRPEVAPPFHHWSIYNSLDYDVSISDQLKKIVLEVATIL